MSNTTTLELTAHQADILVALRDICARAGWPAQPLVVEGELVLQSQLPNDPNISGAMWIVEAVEPIVRLYLFLPFNAAVSRMAEAALFQARAGHGRRFGALELDAEDGALRVRIEADVYEDTLDATLARLLDRALALARAVAPGWRALAHEGVEVEAALLRCEG